MGVEGVSGVKSEVFNRGTMKGEMMSEKAIDRKDRKDRKDRLDRPGRVADASALESRADAPATRAELDEFLAADYLETRADSEFRKRLRKDLWALVWNRYGPGSSSSGSGSR
jgi:hypothetical protein